MCMQHLLNITKSLEKIERLLQGSRLTQPEVSAKEPEGWVMCQWSSVIKNSTCMNWTNLYFVGMMTLIWLREWPVSLISCSFTLLRVKVIHWWKASEGWVTLICSCFVEMICSLEIKGTCYFLIGFSPGEVTTKISGRFEGVIVLNFQIFPIFCRALVVF